MKHVSYIICTLALLIAGGCKKDVFLKEEPRDDIYAENLLVDRAGFEAMITALQGLMRQEYRRMDAIGDGSLPFAHHTIWAVGTDNAWSNNTHRELRFMYYPKFIDQTDLDCFRLTFEWLYRMVNTANMVISRAAREGIDWGGASDAERVANKESVVATARFFRAWAYRHITYSFGDAPLSLEEIDGTNYRTDWERNPVAEIRAAMEEDFRYAVEKLPLRATTNTKVSGALARHYLGELYLAMGRPDDARQVLQPLVEGSDYRLMAERFGTNAQQAGNAFIDVFRSPLYAEGNMEVLYAFLNTEPEVAAYGTATIYIKSSWKNYYSNDGVIRNSNQEAPNYVSGSVTWPQQFWLTNGGKGAGRAVPSLGAIRLYNYKGQGEVDDRVSNESMVWKIYEENATGQRVEFLNGGKSIIDTTVTAAMLDDNRTTIQNYKWPSTRKWDYDHTIAARGDADQSYNNTVYVRLAETYLLYAEALFKLGDFGHAVEWINRVRKRAHAAVLSASDLQTEGLDLILDERSRELLCEEERRHTLIRVSQENGGDERDVNNYFKRRVRALNEICGRPVRGMNDHDTPVLFPIPQEFMDSNTDRELQQNPGYH